MTKYGSYFILMILYYLNRTNKWQAT